MSSSSGRERADPHAVAVKRMTHRGDAEPGQPVNRALVAVLLTMTVSPRVSSVLLTNHACSEPT